MVVVKKSCGVNHVESLITCILSFCIASSASVLVILELVQCTCLYQVFLLLSGQKTPP